MNLPLTDYLADTFTVAAQEFRDHAERLRKAPEYSAAGSLGEILRAAAEEHYQRAAVLDDIVKRYKESK